MATVKKLVIGNKDVLASLPAGKKINPKHEQALLDSLSLNLSAQSVRESLDVIVTEAFKSGLEAESPELVKLLEKIDSMILKSSTVIIEDNEEKTHGIECPRVVYAIIRHCLKNVSFTVPERGGGGTPRNKKPEDFIEL